MLKPVQYLYERYTHWMNQEVEEPEIGLSDLSRALPELRQADVILVEGRTRIGRIIKQITLSPWSHAALYVGRICDQHNSELRDLLSHHFSGSINEPLVLEAQLGDGTILSPLSKYKDYHIRICRPRRLTFNDSEEVIVHAAAKLGFDYDIRHIFDLARFMAPYYLAPYGLLPKRWRSSLFNPNKNEEARAICSTLIGQAFHSVEFPVKPVLEEKTNGNMQMSKADPRFYTPADFDASPYFDIIKYPLIGFDDLAVYRSLPWKSANVEPPEVNEIDDTERPPSGIMPQWLKQMAKLTSFGK